MSEDIVGQIKDIKGRTWQEAFYIQTKAFLEKNSEHLKEIERLKAEVERLTAFTTRTIIPNEELQADNAMLKEEISEAAGHYNKIINDLEAQVERLTKAGDAMVPLLGRGDWHIARNDWNAAKEGKGQP
jgi:regulator of replication initiation timing